MSLSDLFTAGSALGVPGLLVAFIFWMETNNRRDRRDHHDQDLQAQKDSTDANLKIATALEALKTIIMGGRHV